MSGFGLEGEPLCFVELLDACLGRGSLDALNCVFFLVISLGAFACVICILSCAPFLVLLVDSFIYLS